MHMYICGPRIDISLQRNWYKSLENFRGGTVVDRAAGFAQGRAPSDLIHERVAHLHRVDDRHPGAHHPSDTRRPTAHSLRLQCLLLLCQLSVERLQKLGRGSRALDTSWCVIRRVFSTQLWAVVCAVLRAVARVY